MIPERRGSPLPKGTDSWPVSVIISRMRLKEKKALSKERSPAPIHIQALQPERFIIIFEPEAVHYKIYLLHFR